jgi:hypothetical protein
MANLDVHHQLPRSRSGLDLETNLITLSVTATKLLEAFGADVTAARSVSKAFLLALMTVLETRN